MSDSRFDYAADAQKKFLLEVASILNHTIMLSTLACSKCGENVWQINNAQRRCAV